MRIGKQTLKQVIMEETLRYLEEGKQEKSWIANQPEEEQEHWISAERQGLKVSELSWIKKVRGDEPIEDIIGDVVSFKSSETQQKIEPINRNLSTKMYKSVNDLRRLLMDIEEADDLDSKEDNVFQDSNQVQDLGKVGKWQLLMPNTQKGSIACDISTKDTTWCTTKRKGQNLFYSYVGRKDEDIILFYVMDYSRTPNLTGKDADARLSIGFLNGQPVLKGQNGGLSVDAENDGLTEEDLRNYLGNDYDKIMNILQAKTNEVGSSHPAKVMLKKAAKNLKLLKKLVKNFRPDEKDDFLNQVIKQDDISPAVMIFLAKNSSNDYWKMNITKNPNTPPEVLLVFASDENNYVRTLVAENPNTPLKALLILANDGNEDVRTSVAKNPNTPPEALLILAKDEDDEVKESVAENSNTPLEILLVLAEDWNRYVRMSVISNPSTPPEVLLALSKDESKLVREDVASSPNTPLEALLILANDGNEDVRTRVAKNPNTPLEVLLALSKDISRRVKAGVVKNPNTPPEILHVLVNDGDHYTSAAAKLSIKERGQIAETKKHKFSKKRLRQIIMEELLKTLNK